MRASQITNFHAAAVQIPKLIQVCLSCTEPEHADTAINYIAAWSKRHDLNKIESIALNHIRDALLQYLMDTREHAEHTREWGHGFHKPARNGWQTVRVWPNINDYIGDILGMKIPTHWLRRPTYNPKFRMEVV